MEYTVYLDGEVQQIGAKVVAPNYQQLRIIIQFPNTFWHNRECNVDPMKNDKLESDGWRVLIVQSKSPSRQNIQDVVDQI